MRLRLGNCLWLMGLLVVLGLGLLVEAPAGAQDKKPDHSAVKPDQRKDAGPVKRHEAFVERAKKGNVDVLFLGDSITQGWEGKDAWKVFDKLKAANFGIGGDRTQHVLWRITEGKELDGIQPKVAVLMIGTNNVGSNSAAEIADGVKAIVTELQRQRPEMKVLLLGVFPRSGKPVPKEQTKIKADELQPKIKDINDIIAKLNDGQKIYYLNINDKFLDKDGGLDRAVMNDLLHLTPRGYQIWADAIQPKVEELLK